MFELFFVLPETFRFLIVGGGNTIVGCGVILLMQYSLASKLPAQVIYLLSYVITSVPSFFSMRLFVFSIKGGSVIRYITEYGKYLVSTLLNCLIGIVVLSLFVDSLKINVYVSQIVALAASVTSGFVLYKFFAFQKSPFHSRSVTSSTINFNENAYSASSDNAIVSRSALGVRKKIFDFLIKTIPLDSDATILDVGVTADSNRMESNFFELFYPHKDHITAFSDQDASWMMEKWPGLRFLRGDGRCMPFADNEFDLVFSSAVIEHVGDRVKQASFIKECARVAKGDVFITTPNRWHPLEFHTALPFLHWLPVAIHRKVLAFFGYELLSKEENLNLLDKKELFDICSSLNLDNCRISSVSFLGFSSNLLLHIKKS